MSFKRLVPEYVALAIGLCEIYRTRRGKEPRVWCITQSQSMNVVSFQI